MKQTRLFLIGALGIGIAFSSCGYSDGQMTKRQLYNNETFADSEAFTFFKTAHEKAAYELAHARYALEQGATADSRALAEKIIAVYSEMLPELEQLAADKQVIVPDPGALVFKVESEDITVDTDSLTTVETRSFDGSAYVAHVQKEQAEILNQFQRASRNTDKDVRKYCTDRLETIKEIYTMAGGEIDDNSHH